MVDLDDLKAMRKLDKSDVYGSIEAFSQQCIHAWEDNKDLEVPDSYKDVNKIVMTGMGGSGLGARIIESIFGSELEYPLVRVNGYDLPSWADEKTLVICSSFSGTTEETVETARQAQEKNCKWMAIGTGGVLIDLARKYEVPYYKIVPTYNPSKQPRLAIGYSVVGQLIMAAKTGIIAFEKRQMQLMVSAMKKVLKVCAVGVTVSKNPAKKTAKKLMDKGVIFVSARHMGGAVHTVKNQMNENVKNFSARFDVPELNHHLMEGLGHPSLNKKYLLFFFVDSVLYPKRLQKRMLITQDVVSKYKIPKIVWQAKAKDELSQAFEFIQFGGFVNFYLVMLYGIDPAPIPWVDYFKTRLGQPLGQWK
jgi:glucose/mannose-6-phosphate isomerase